jgi:predicted RNA-binding Zn-ribbon protein involved in translation (DUF1610 family)
MSFDDFCKVGNLVHPSWFVEHSVVVMPRTALYHHERGRKFRPTKSEAQSGRFSCPKCQKVLVKVRFRAGEFGYTCPRCNWSIHRDDIWSPQQKEVPVAREPGDITDLNDASNTIGIDISMEELDNEGIPVV